MTSEALLLVISLSLICVVACHQEPGDICLSIRHESANTRPETRNARPGKSGPAGLPGLVGAKGEPGQCACNPDKLNQLREEMEALEGQIRSLILRTNQHIKRACTGGLVYDNTCTFLPYVKGSPVTYTEAVRICSSKNSSVAEITNDIMYDRVFQYLNTTWVQQNGDRHLQYAYFWLGSTFEPVNNPSNKITLSSGRKITLSRWFPSLPRTGINHSDRVNLMTEVSLMYRTPNNRNNDLWNVPPNQQFIPLCQFII